MHARSRRALAGLLERQREVVTFAQVVAARCDPELPAREVAAGRWQRMCRGIYLASNAPPSDLQQAWCAQLVGGSRSVVTGAVVCRILGVADVPTLPMAVLVGADCRRAPGPEVHCLRTSRAAASAVRDDGLRLAGPARAVVDAARACHGLRDVRGLIMAALNGKHTTVDALGRELESGPRRGSALVRRTLTDWADGARSAPEAELADELRALARDGTMLPFLLNPRLYDGAVLLGAPDVYVPDAALGAETDSRRHHGSVDDLDATLTRHADFAAAGVRLEHVTPARFRQNPLAWAAQLAAVAQERHGMTGPTRLRIEPVGPLQPVPGRRRTSPGG